MGPSDASPAAGDLLRAEQNRPGSAHGEMIRTYIREGQVVPMEVTIKLLENAMREALETRKDSGADGWTDGRGRFLIDGFPRKMDQALKFDEDVRIPLHFYVGVKAHEAARCARRRWCCSSQPRRTR